MPEPFRARPALRKFAHTQFFCSIGTRRRVVLGPRTPRGILHHHPMDFATDVETARSSEPRKRRDVTRSGSHVGRNT